MAFRLTSEITIGNFRFNGVHDVHIKRGMHSVLDSALIRLPSVAVSRKGKLSDMGVVEVTGKASVKKNTRDYFSDRDPVTIKLGYNGEMKTEFEGFVKQRSLGMPLEVECEGYNQRLRLDAKYTKVTNKKMSVKNILLDMLATIENNEIGLICDVNALVEGVGFTNANGLQVIDTIRDMSDRQLTFFWLDFHTLYCGLPFTPTINGSDTFGIGEAGYRLGYNLKRDNALKMKIPSEPVTVIMGGRYAAQAGLTTSQAKYAKTKTQSMLNHFGDNGFLKQLATEKMNVLNYTGMEGKLTGFLQPFCEPGYKVKLIDKLNGKDGTGTYLCESMEVMFGVGGSKRMVELGPKIS